MPTDIEIARKLEAGINREVYDKPSKVSYNLELQQGISEEVVRTISKRKKEPAWMLELRLKGLKYFQETPTPTWGPDLSKLDISQITFYRDPATKETTTWDEVPEEIKETFEKLGIPEAERKALSGVGAQFESEIVYHNLKKEWEKKGVIFENMDVALKKYPELVKKHFMTRCIPINDHKFIMLHAAVWSGGTFIYVPENVKITVPLQAYFRMNEAGAGQFEHTLIIVEKNAEVHYIEGCSAPRYEKNSLHAGCVEVYAMEGSKVKYSSIENWSKNTYNLNTKRAIAEKNSVVEWIGGNLGSCATMLYPATILKGEGATAHHISIAFAGKGQHQDTGAKVIHLAPHTSSTINSKSIAKDGGKTTYRGLVMVGKGARQSAVHATCDALILDEFSKNDTFPYMDIKEKTTAVVHEATVGKLSAEKLFYLQSRGLTEEQAAKLIINGFMEPIVKELPLEYALEINKLIELEMENAIG